MVVEVGTGGKGEGSILALAAEKSKLSSKPDPEPSWNCGASFVELVDGIFPIASSKAFTPELTA